MDAKNLDRAAVVERVNAFYDAGDYDQALVWLDPLIEIDGETSNLLDFKFDVLMKLGRYQEAKAAGGKLEQIASRKSPWNCLKIAEACLGMGEIDEALAWLEKAIVERYFKRSDVFAGQPYVPLKENPRFLKLLDRARENIGLDKPVQDFSVGLIDGGEFSISAMQGRVVLIDFWATDCPPCVREMPAIKDLYAEYKDQGFEIIGISLDTNKAAAKKYISDNDIQWRICCSGKGFQDDLADRFKIESIPSTWLVDKSGILRFYQLKEQALRDAVGQLLAEQNRRLKCTGDYCTMA